PVLVPAGRGRAGVLLRCTPGDGHGTLVARPDRAVHIRSRAELGVDGAVHHRRGLVVHGGGLCRGRRVRAIGTRGGGKHRGGHRGHRRGRVHLTPGLGTVRRVRGVRGHRADGRCGGRGSTTAHTALGGGGDPGRCVGADR